MALRKQKPNKAIKGSYVLIFLEYLKAHHQLDVESILAQAGMSYHDLNSRRCFLTTDQYINLLKIVASKINLHACVFELIPELEVTQHGVMGLLIMCGLTLSHALTAFLKFYRLQSNLITFSKIERDDKVHLIMTPVLNLGEFEKYTIQMCMAAFYNTKRQLLGAMDCTGQVCFTHAQDDNDSQDASFYQCEVLYNQPENEIIFPSEQLLIKLKSASQSTFEVLEEQCEQSLETIKEGSDVINEVQQFLRAQESLNISLQDAADYFATSTRTFSRYMQKSGVNFQSLLDQERVRRAKDLLIYTDLNLTDISYQLGFSDSSHFTKVFKRETKQLPSSFRKTIS